ncbi:hypothetical protein AVEN_241283-1 [Araneus ventricosus]|uniref:Uncharacterized protein n=1 Tax=Araneus ventricosus TaxID=182803 RepID=A0A4Y2JGB7_ARAVE|nr:hypothetical protein AVEN_241283-1 [Araneus ventricosus]
MRARYLTSEPARLKPRSRCSIPSMHFVKTKWRHNHFVVTGNAVKVLLVNHKDIPYPTTPLIQGQLPFFRATLQTPSLLLSSLTSAKLQTCYISVHPNTE